MNLLRFAMFLPILIIVYLIFSKVQFNISFDVSIDKLFNVVIIVLIGVLFYKFNNLAQNK